MATRGYDECTCPGTWGPDTQTLIPTRSDTSSYTTPSKGRLQIMYPCQWLIREGFAASCSELENDSKWKLPNGGNQCGKLLHKFQEFPAISPPPPPRVSRLQAATDNLFNEFFSGHAILWVTPGGLFNVNMGFDAVNARLMQQGWPEAHTLTWGSRHSESTPMLSYLHPIRTLTPLRTFRYE